MVSVHDLSGRLICPQAAIPTLLASEGPWSELKHVDGRIRCPDGTRVRVPGWSDALPAPSPTGR
jgi:hypothetical protein